MKKYLLLAVLFIIMSFANEKNNDTSSGSFPVYMTTDQFVKMMKEKEMKLKESSENKVIHPEKLYEDKYKNKDKEMNSKKTTENKVIHPEKLYEDKHKNKDKEEDLKSKNKVVMQAVKIKDNNEYINKYEQEELSKRMDKVEETSRRISHFAKDKNIEHKNLVLNSEYKHNSYKEENLNNISSNLEEPIEQEKFVPHNTSYYNANLLYGKISHKKHLKSPHINESEWKYGNGNHGPYFWGSLKPEYKICEVGERQTPININTKEVLDIDTPPIILNYSGRGHVFFNNGHTVEVEVEGNNIARIDGIKYKLLQFHFHTHSENTINNQYFQMEGHFVHKSKEGKLAVIAVMFKKGRYNPILEKLIRRIPKNFKDINDISNLYLNLRELLPQDLSYYKFSGSLTTPPCTEGVTWIVLETPLEASSEQLEQFRKVLGDNYRPIQSLNGRLVVK